MTALGLCFFVATTGYLLFRLARLYRRGWVEDCPADQRRTVSRQMMRAVAYWQASIGGLLLLGPGPATAAITPAITVLGAGAIIWFGQWLSQQFEGVL